MVNYAEKSPQKFYFKHFCKEKTLLHREDFLNGEEPAKVYHMEKNFQWSPLLRTLVKFLPYREYPLKGLLYREGALQVL